MTARAELLSLQNDLKQSGTPDASITQMLALATYKGGKPTVDAALGEARGYLAELDPANSHDTETLGLWGAIHKRIWDRSRDPAALNEAIRGYERGFQLRQDYYNGINYAFLLNVRAHELTGTKLPEAVTDWVIAERVRQQVLEICATELQKIPAVDVTADDAASKELIDRKYWILATLQEAAAGLGDDAAMDQWKQQAAALNPAGWMLESTISQIMRLQQLLADPPTRALGAAAGAGT